jgi:hypothetical protein
MLGRQAWEPSIIVELIKVLCSGRLLSLPTNIGLGWKRKEEAGTLAYYDMATIKSFIEQRHVL